MRNERQHRKPRIGGIRARQHLTGEIARQVKAGEKRLPTIPQMAAAAHVSRSTMHRAVREMQSAGILIAKQQRGILLTDSVNQSSDNSTASTAESRYSDTLRGRIQSDILQGRYNPGQSLPTGKELSTRYGASHPTLRKALDSLALAGLIEHWKRGFRIPSRKAPVTRNRIMLAVRGSASVEGGLGISSLAPRQPEQFQSLALECTRAGLNLDFARYQFVGRNLVGPDGTNRLQLSPAQLDDVLGFMVWAQGLGLLDPPEFVAHLAGYGKPVAVLDVNGQHDFRPLLQTGSAVRVFALGITPRCAEQVGDYLIGLGHTRVACICDTTLSQRQKGLQSAFDKAGMPEAVRNVLYGPTKVATSKKTTTSPSALLLNLLRKNKPVNEPLIRMITRNAEYLHHRVSEEAHFENLDGILRALLADRGITAWVADTDAVALRCLEFLHRLGVRVPEDISVIGYDDTEDAFLQNLTSYNFNVPAVIHAMTEHLVRPQPYRPDIHGRRHTVIDGFVNVRKSSAEPGTPRRVPGL